MEEMENGWEISEEWDIAFCPEDWIKELKERREAYGIPQSRVAQYLGMSREHYSRIESGKKQASRKVLESLERVLEILNPDREMDVILDYVRIRFRTTNAREVIEKILRIRFEYMVEEKHAFYGYRTQFVRGNIVVMTSVEEEKGTLLELKGMGCREFEAILKAQRRNWYDFFRQVREGGAVFKRIDIASNDRAGILDVRELAEKCRREECKSLFHTFRDYRSGEIAAGMEQYADMMGYTLYIGSLKSDVYFCVYEKDYEQYVKFGLLREETDIKNRFEIRLKNDRAEKAVDDFLEYEDAAGTAFSIIQRYVCFLDCDEEKERRSWPVNPRWAWFMDGEHRDIRLTMKPEPFSIDRTLAWIVRQVAPTLRAVSMADEQTGEMKLRDIIEKAKLGEKHRKIVEQLTTPIERAIMPEKLEEWQEALIREYMPYMGQLDDTGFDQDTGEILE